VNAKITDKRTQFAIGSTPRFGFYLPGTLSVSDDQSWNPICIQAQTFQGIYAFAGTAPVGSILTARIYNVTQSQAVGSISISAGAQNANTTSFTNASVNAGDVLRVDITAIGSTTPGANLTLVLY
jgi:hypothetical protein